MIASIELPEPSVLWTRWVTLAAALSALGHDDVWSVDARGAHHDDGGGNWAHLALIEDGRAVLYGYDHEYSDTVDADPPIDLLAGAPSWLPWDELVRCQAEDQLGYVLWHTAGTGWQRVSYPAAERDGLDTTADEVMSDRATITELGEVVFQWGEHPTDHPDEREEVAAAATGLLEAAARRRVDPPALAALLGRLPSYDPAVAMAVAARGGITAGSAPPIVAPGRPPARRRVRRLSDTEHDRLIWTAMQGEDERTRPAPVPTGELGALVTWLRSRAPAGDGRCSLLIYADDSSLAGQQGEHPVAERPGEGNFGAFREMGDLVRRLRAAEADPAYGRWFFLRVETTAEDVTVERRYDSWPPWWEDNGISGPWRTNLKTEIEARDPAWQPSWTELLRPEIAYRPAD